MRRRSLGIIIKVNLLIGFKLLITDCLMAGDSVDSPVTGDKWNESEIIIDESTSAFKRKLTKNGLLNNTSSYHYRTGFSEDSKYVFIKTMRNNYNGILRAKVNTGELTLMEIFGKDSVNFNNIHFVIRPAHNSLIVKVYHEIKEVYQFYEYNIHSLKKSLLLELEPGIYTSHLACGPAGKKLFWAQMPHLEGYSGKERFDAYTKTYGGMPTSIYAYTISTKQKSLVYYDSIAGTDHIQTHPDNPNLLLIDRDFPEWYSWRGDMGKSSRAWVLNTETSELIEIRPLNPNKFVSHSTWSSDGKMIYYHSRDKETGFEFFGKNGGGHYIGVCDLYGNVIWERIFPHFYYGHIGSHTTRNSLIFDGLLTPNMICEIDFTHLKQTEKPEVKIVCNHDSYITTGYQPGHPHLQLSHDGHWLMYNWSDGKRSDVLVVDLNK